MKPRAWDAAKNLDWLRCAISVVPVTEKPAKRPKLDTVYIASRVG